MTKLDAVKSLIIEAGRPRLTAKGARQIGAACAALGLSLGETIDAGDVAEYGGFRSDMTHGHQRQAGKASPPERAR